MESIQRSWVIVEPSFVRGLLVGKRANQRANDRISWLREVHLAAGKIITPLERLMTTVVVDDDLENRSRALTLGLRARLCRFAKTQATFAAATEPGLASDLIHTHASVLLVPYVPNFLLLLSW
jgi:hypothetical protein